MRLHNLPIVCELRNANNTNVANGFLNEGDVFTISSIDAKVGTILVKMKRVTNAHIITSKKGIERPYEVHFRDHDGKKGWISINAKNEYQAKLKFNEHGFGGHITSIWKNPKWKNNDSRKVMSTG